MLLIIMSMNKSVMALSIALLEANAVARTDTTTIASNAYPTQPKYLEILFADFVKLFISFI